MSNQQNSSNISSSSSDSLYHRLLLPSYILSLIVSVISLLSLAFTLWIFAKKRDATAGARGMVLLIVTGVFTAMSLTVLYVCRICEQRWTDLETSQGTWRVFNDLQFVITNTSLLLRNWWVTFLTVSRFLVILFPLHVPEMLTRRRQLVAFLIILAASAGVSSVRHAEDKSCSAAPSEAENGTGSAEDDNSCENFILVFFVVQTGLPVPAVLTLSVALAAHLCAAAGPEPTSGVTSSSAGGRRPTLAEATSRGRKRKATRILLVLAGTFTVLELPTFLYYLWTRFVKDDGSMVKQQLVVSCLNALITLDTLANFFVFFVLSESFKREVSRRLLCLCLGGRPVAETTVAVEMQPPATRGAGSRCPTAAGSSAGETCRHVSR